MAEMSPDRPEQPAAADGRPTLSGAAFAVAAAVLLAWAALVVFMLVSSSARELRWTRLAWVFSSVEAVAFGAAGALFGSSIQRQRAERAENAASRSAAAAANGQALAASLKADEAAVQAGGGSLIGAGPGGDQAAVAAQLARRHAELARQLFPDRSS
jgi:hypothetical protein